MTRLPPRSTRTDPLFPFTALYRPDERLVAVAAERPWRFRRRQDFAVRAGCRACHAKPEQRRQQQRQEPPGGGRKAVASHRIVLQHPKGRAAERSEEHTSELQSLMRISYAVFCIKKKKKSQKN